MQKQKEQEKSLSMWDYYITAITTKYAAFKGIATRKEYWSFVLFYTLFSLPFGILALLGIFFLVDLTWLNSIYKIVFFIPAVAIMIRRMHDVGWSAWLMLTIVAPFIAIFLPTNPNSKYAQEKSLPLTKGKKITIAVVLSLLSLGTIIDAFVTKGTEDTNKFSEVFTALCYDTYTDSVRQQECLQELHTYIQALKDKKYKINCEDSKEATASYAAYLNESRSYDMSGIAQIKFLAVSALEIANDEKCDISSWIEEDLPAIEEYIATKPTETDNISQGLQELQDMSSDEMNDLVLQGMRQGYNQRCSATCLSRPNQQEMCRCICQVLAQTMSLQDFQYIMNYGEDEWVRQDRGKNILQNALNKCGN